MHESQTILGNIRRELKAHVPFTIAGTLLGVGAMAIVVSAGLTHWAEPTFEVMHPLHVLLSALATTGVYRRYSRGGVWATIAVGYFGSVGVATISDSLIPYLGEWLLDLPASRVHLGFIELWYLVNPLAAAGIAAAYFYPKTKVSHGGHVLLSVFASQAHMTMALGGDFGFLTLAVLGVFLFLAVWIPCCTSDIVFPLLFAGKEGSACHRRAPES
ncbi:MAG TPA: hypothetical protein VMY42_11025 [Thermoguttaceae bacterium]|nr:hypothetical protein [Thermoguttaceae bacterium]